MKLFTRSNFLQLPRGTIFSRANVDDEVLNILEELYCKVSNMTDLDNDWLEQDLITSFAYPDGLDGLAGMLWVEEQRNSFQRFETDLDSVSRDGCFDSDDVFVVWEKDDVEKLVNYLQEALRIGYVQH